MDGPSRERAESKLTGPQLGSGETARRALLVLLVERAATATPAESVTLGVAETE